MAEDVSTPNRQHAQEMKSYVDNYGIVRYRVSAFGRFTEFSPEKAVEICNRIASGETLTRICRDEHMPSPPTVYRWLRDFPDFYKLYTEAREMQADYEVDQIKDLSEACGTDPGEVAKARLLTGVLQWRAARMRPSKWGRKVEVKSSDGEFKDWSELMEVAEAEADAHSDVDGHSDVSQLTDGIPDGREDDET